MTSFIKIHIVIHRFYNIVEKGHCGTYTRSVVARFESYQDNNTFANWIKSQVQVAGIDLRITSIFYKEYIFASTPLDLDE